MRDWRGGLPVFEGHCLGAVIETGALELFARVDIASEVAQTCGVRELISPMQSLFRHRFFVPVVAILFLLLVLVGARNYATRFVKIGDFSLPKISGWQRKVRDSQIAPAVMYEKKNGDERLYIGLSYHLDRVADAPKTAADLQNEQDKGAQAMAPLMQRLGMQVQEGPTVPIQLNGMIAVESHDVITSKEDVTYGRDIWFINGNNYYILRATIRVPPTSATAAPADLQAEMDRALQIVLSNLRAR